jgi:hypothetical protein
MHCRLLVSRAECGKEVMVKMGKARLGNGPPSGFTNTLKGGESMDEKRSAGQCSARRTKLLPDLWSLLMLSEGPFTLSDLDTGTSSRLESTVGSQFGVMWKQFRSYLLDGFP